MSSVSPFLMCDALFAQDFIVKGTLNLNCLKLCARDEADEMLNMGFVDDIELILGKVEDVTNLHVLYRILHGSLSSYFFLSWC
ncbi:unnamed protein product [Urochloa humidicola]